MATPVMNPFTGTGFDLLSMTQEINRMPNLYGRLEQMGMFPIDGIATTSVAIEMVNGTINLVKSQPRGGPGNYNKADKRKLKTIPVPHFPMEDSLLPEEYQNVRAFGTPNQLETQASVLARKMQRIKNSMDQTFEFLRMGALKGLVLDADGSTLVDLYDEFDVTAKVIDFVLDNADTEVITKCLSVKRWMEQHLFGERMTGVRVLCSSSFYDALTTHPAVKDAYKYFLNNAQTLSGDYRRGFTFGEITFEEYVATWTDSAGTVRKALEDNEAMAFPEGTSDTFQMFAAPGNFLETANTIGIPYYARQEPRRFNAGLDVHVESNVLPICRRPELLVKVTV